MAGPTTTRACLLAAMALVPAVLAGCVSGEGKTGPEAPAATVPFDDGKPDPDGEYPCGLVVRAEPPRVAPGEGATIRVSMKNCAESDLLFRGDACNGALAMVLTREGQPTGPGSIREPWILDADGAPALGQRICPKVDPSPLILRPGSVVAREVRWNGTLSDRQCGANTECWLAYDVAAPGTYHVGSRATAGDTSAREAPLQTIQAQAAIDVAPPGPPLPAFHERFRALGRGKAPGDAAATLVLDSMSEWTRFAEKVDGPDTRAPLVNFSTHRVVAAVLGGRPNGCHDLEILSVRTDAAAKETVVTLRERAPAAGLTCPDGERDNPWTAAAIRATGTRVRFLLQKATGEWLPIRALAGGPDSGVREAETVVVANETAWAALWARHDAGATPPPVNFSRERVVAVFMGERPTGGYDVRVKAPRLVDGKLVVDVVRLGPEPDAAVTEAATAPFHMVAIPDLHGEVVASEIRLDQA